MSDFRAKRNQVLDNLKQELNKGFIEKEFEIKGHKYKLRTLNEDDEIWADSYLRITTAAAIISSRKAPRLAVSLQAIDGVSRNELFQPPDDMPKEAKAALQSNPVQMRYWLNDQMLYFLLEESNRPFINDLWEKYDLLDKERDQAISNLPN